MAHDWKEAMFEHGVLHPQTGQITCLQHWKCRGCGEGYALPMGTHPIDYQQTPCKGDQNDRSSHGSNVPRARVQESVRLQNYRER